MYIVSREILINPIPLLNICNISKKDKKPLFDSQVIYFSILRQLLIQLLLHFLTMPDKYTIISLLFHIVSNKVSVLHTYIGLEENLT
jgi:hypothetical protein